MELRPSQVPGLCALSFALVLAAGPVAAQTLTATPSAVNFSYSDGQPSPEPVEVAITSSTGTTPELSASVAPRTSTPAGLFQVTVSESELTIGIDRGILSTIAAQQGLYGADITLAAPGFTSLAVPVTLNIGLGTLSLQVNPTSLIFNMLSGTTSQTVSVTATSGANVAFTVAAATSYGGNWLAVTTSAGYTPATLTVSVNPGTLPPATYAGSITVSPSTGGTLAIPVTLQAGASSALTVNPATFSFAYTVGGAVPPAQVLHLTSNIANNTFKAQAFSTGNWLLANGVTTLVTGTLPEDLNVTVSPAALLGGSYQGTITITSGDGSSQIIPVSLTVNGGVSTIANPTSLSFVAQAGGAAPAHQLIVVNASGNTGFNASVVSVGAWLSISQTSGATPAQISVMATPAALAAGTYTGSITVTVGSRTQIVQATLTISANPVLAANPAAVVVYYMGGNPVPTPTAVTVSASAGDQQTFSVAGGQPSWLQVLTGTGFKTPSTVSVSMSPGTLATGTYVANILVTPAASGGIPLTVPVLLVVSGATPVVPGVSSLTFSGAPASGPQVQTVTAAASTPTAFNAAVSTASGGSWLSVTPASGTATPLGVPLTVTADATHLTAGNYQGTIGITTNLGVLSQIAVTFNVGTGGTISVKPAMLSFSYTQGGTAPASQTVQVTGSQNFTAAAHTNDGGTWLTVSPASGSGNAGLTVKANPAGLTAGTYTGAITVTPASGTAQSVAITLSVMTASIAVTPASLSFTYHTGDTAPPAQTLTLSSATGVQFAASASSTGWLSVTPATGTTPGALTVSVDPTQLGAGSYSGTITITGPSGVAPVNIAVSLAVSAALPSISRVVNAASYLSGGISPGEIVSIFGAYLGPAAGKSGAPDSRGFFGTSLGNVTVTFNGFAAPLLYAGAGQVNAVVPYALAGSPSALVVLTFGTGRSNSVTVPVVSSAPGIFTADGSGTGAGAILDTNYRLVSANNPVSRGSFIQIFATGEGQTSPAGIDGKVAPSVLPLPAPKLPVAVLIGGQPVTVQYIGAAPGLVAGVLQINVQVPDSVPPGVVPVSVQIGDNFCQMGITVAVQ